MNGGSDEHVLAKYTLIHGEGGSSNVLIGLNSQLRFSVNRGRLTVSNGTGLVGEVESFSLKRANDWLRVARKTDSLLFIIKETENFIKKFRIKFRSCHRRGLSPRSAAGACADALQQFCEVRNLDSSSCEHFSDFGPARSCNVSTPAGAPYSLRPLDSRTQRSGVKRQVFGRRRLGSNSGDQGSAGPDYQNGLDNNKTLLPQPRLDSSSQHKDPLLAQTSVMYCSQNQSIGNVGLTLRGEALWRDDFSQCSQNFSQRSGTANSQTENASQRGNMSRQHEHRYGSARCPPQDLRRIDKDAMADVSLKDSSQHSHGCDEGHHLSSFSSSQNSQRETNEHLATNRSGWKDDQFFDKHENPKRLQKNHDSSVPGIRGVSGDKVEYGRPRTNGKAETDCSLSKEHGHYEAFSSENLMEISKFDAQRSGMHRDLLQPTANRSLANAINCNDRNDDFRLSAKEFAQPLTHAESSHHSVSQPSAPRATSESGFSERRRSNSKELSKQPSVLHANGNSNNVDVAKNAEPNGRQHDRHPRARSSQHSALNDSFSSVSSLGMRHPLAKYALEKSFEDGYSHSRGDVVGNRESSNKSLNLVSVKPVASLGTSSEVCDRNTKGESFRVHREATDFYGQTQRSVAQPTTKRNMTNMSVVYEICGQCEPGKLQCNRKDQESTNTGPWRSLGKTDGRSSYAVDAHQKDSCRIEKTTNSLITSPQRAKKSRVMNVTFDETSSGLKHNLENVPPGGQSLHDREFAGGGSQFNSLQFSKNNPSECGFSLENSRKRLSGNDLDVEQRLGGVGISKIRNIRSNQGKENQKLSDDAIGKSLQPHHFSQVSPRHNLETSPRRVSQDSRRNFSQASYSGFDSQMPTQSQLSNKQQEKLNEQAWREWRKIGSLNDNERERPDGLSCNGSNQSDSNRKTAVELSGLNSCGDWSQMSTQTQQLTTEINLFGHGNSCSSQEEKRIDHLASKPSPFQLFSQSSTQTQPSVRSIPSQNDLLAKHNCCFGDAPVSSGLSAACRQEQKRSRRHELPAAIDRISAPQLDGCSSGNETGSCSVSQEITQNSQLVPDLNSQVAAVPDAPDESTQCSLPALNDGSQTVPSSSSLSVTTGSGMLQNQRSSARLGCQKDVHIESRANNVYRKHDESYTDAARATNSTTNLFGTEVMSNESLLSLALQDLPHRVVQPILDRYKTFLARGDASPAQRSETQLKNYLRACLMDPTFPDFVRSVEETLQEYLGF